MPCSKEKENSCPCQSVHQTPTSKSMSKPYEKKTVNGAWATAAPANQNPELPKKVQYPKGDKTAALANQSHHPTVTCTWLPPQAMCEL